MIGYEFLYSEGMNNKVYIETLGCVKNRVDSEIMIGALLSDGLELAPTPQDAEIVTINTCGFIEKAVTESIDRILQLAEYKKEGLCKKIIVTGCLSERYRDRLLKEIPEIDAILGSSDFTQISSVIKSILTERSQMQFLEDRPLYSSKNQNVNRVLSTSYYAYLKIAEGCSNMCSFCNIPQLRGGFKSRSIESIVHECQDLLNRNIKEINLISQDTSSYGVDLKDNSNLLKLVQQILRFDKSDFWLRIFYSYPNTYPLELFSIMNKDERFTPYVDMPFQHVSDPVLKAMNRKIGADDIHRIVDAAFNANEDIALRTTFMVGFPNETDGDFNKLVEFVEKGLFRHIGVFTYSDEDNISSTRLGDRVPLEIKEERKQILMEVQQKISFRKNEANIGQIQKVLIEGIYEETELLLKGRNRCQGPDVDGLVLVNSGQAEAGEFTSVRITGAHPYDLIGEII